MPRATSFTLNRSGLLLALISAAFAGKVDAAAGRVEFAIGGATVSGPGGSQRPVRRGEDVNSGDVLRTSEGRVQLRMSDGSYISLQPNTEFGIKEYKYEGKADGTESAFYSLLKGAMRTVTGLIGRVNRGRYQVATPTATVGIRGTGGVIEVQGDGSTLVKGTSGIWFLANPSGSIDVPAGVSGVAPSDPKEPPKETTDIPDAGPSPLPPPPAYVPGDDPKLISGPGYAAAIVEDQQGTFPNLFSSGSAVFNSTGQMTNYSADSFSIFNLDNGSHADFGTDGILAWGRWIGTVTVGCDGTCIPTYNSNQGLHYVVGLPTATMPTSGTATYTLLGATRPTYNDGSAAPGTFSGALTVDFGLRGGVGMNFNVGIDGKSYAMVGTASISGSTFSGSPTVTGTGGACTGGSSCFASVQGFFAGPSAERAGVGYTIDDANKSVLGAAAFSKQ